MLARIEIHIDDVNLDYEGKEWAEEFGSDLMNALTANYPGALVKVFKKEHVGEQCPVCNHALDDKVDVTFVREDYIS
jgi:hypothetical protein